MHLNSHDLREVLALGVCTFLSDSGAQVWRGLDHGVKTKCRTPDVLFGYASENP
jgi:hypothetical protein